jgi:hypothetical protein
MEESTPSHALGVPNAIDFNTNVKIRNMPILKIKNCATGFNIDSLLLNFIFNIINVKAETTRKA